LVPTSAPAILQTLAGTSDFYTAVRAWPDVGRFSPYNRHFQVAPTPFVSRCLEEFEHPLGPPSPPPRSRRLLRSPLLCRNKTDRPHGAKPIEGEDTFRGILASCRGNSKYTFRKS